MCKFPKKIKNKIKLCNAFNVRNVYNIPLISGWTTRSDWYYADDIPQFRGTHVFEIMPATFKKIAYPITPCETNTLWMHHPCDQFGSGQKSGERNTRFINLQHSLPGSCADFAVIITNYANWYLGRRAQTCPHKNRYGGESHISPPRLFELFPLIVPLK